jgi:hypothetical protein
MPNPYKIVKFESTICRRSANICRWTVRDQWPHHSNLAKWRLHGVRAICSGTSCPNSLGWCEIWLPLTNARTKIRRDEKQWPKWQHHLLIHLSGSALVNEGPWGFSQFIVSPLGYLCPRGYRLKWFGVSVIFCILITFLESFHIYIWWVFNVDWFQGK